MPASLNRIRAKTHGGLKYCSSTTYIPRTISLNKKYFPALSNDDSLLWSHRSGFGSLKFAGGGPEGVAYVRAARAASGLAVAGLK